MTVTLPIRLVNPLNGGQGFGWSKVSRRRKQQRSTVSLVVGAHLRSEGIRLPCTVTVTRIAPRKLDAWDGLPASAKAVVDGVADALGIRDDDPRVTWRITQRKGAPKQYAVEIVVEAVST